MAQMEMVRIVRKEKRNEIGTVVREAKVLYESAAFEVAETTSTREDVLRRADVHEAANDLPGAELEVLVAAVPFRVACGDC